MYLFIFVFHVRLLETLQQMRWQTPGGMSISKGLRAVLGIPTIMAAAKTVPISGCMAIPLMMR